METGNLVCKIGSDLGESLTPETGTLRLTALS